MTTLRVNDEEKLVLRNILIEYLGDLRMEICNTDNIRYKQMLRHRKGIIEQILKELQFSMEAPLAE